VTARDTGGPARVVVTGIGPVTPVGTGVDAFWSALLEGRSGVGAITSFDASASPVRIAAEVTDFDPGVYLPAARARWLDRFSQFAAVAAELAIADAKLPLDSLPPDRVGTVIGTGTGGLGGLAQQHDRMAARGPRSVSPAFIGKAIPPAATSAVAIQHGLTGPTDCPVTACAAGAHAIARGADLIRLGAADVVLAGGTEGGLSDLGLAVFHAIGALSTRNDDPAAASRPFDTDRDGFVCGEGAAVLVLEELGSARRRDARIYAELLGAGLSSDAFHAVAPEPDGKGAVAAMERALHAAGRDPATVDHVNAHATSTPTGDPAEARAIARLFGAHRPAVSSTKSMIGHLLGAAGAVEAAATVLAVHHDAVPPTINVSRVDADCPVAVVTGQARDQTVDLALSNSLAFGGHNVSLAFGNPGPHQEVA
jgi:3-oxoacyl-[acyl-carrier-protein] synthase II